MLVAHCKISSTSVHQLILCTANASLQFPDKDDLQYTAKLHGEKVKRFLHKANGKLGVQYFRPRQAHFETSEKLSGYASGCVTPVGLRTPLPIMLSHEIANLQPDFFWMGGGENLLKLGMSVADFVDAYNPVIVDCTY